MSGSHHHLRAIGADPDLLTDFDGGVRLGWILRDVGWPWSSSTLSGYPDGESLMRWQTVAQGIQFGAISMLTRLFEPVVALNILVLAGWLVTGAATAALARRLGLGFWWSIAAGILAQLLPSMPTMAANYTSYVFIGIPVYVVCRAIDVATAPTRRNTAALAAVLAVTFFFDPYWFYFAGFAAVVVLICMPGPVFRQITGGPRWLRLLAILGLLVAVLVPAVILAAGGSASNGVVSRAVSVETARFVDAGLRRPVDWLRSSFEGVGWVVALLGAAAIARAVWTRPRGPAFAAAVTTIALVLMSTRTRVTTPWFTIGSFAEYLRFVMPGVRFFQRSALIAEAMTCVFAAICVRDLVGAVHRRVASPKRALALALALPVLTATVTVIEFAPFDRPVSDRWDDFAEFRSILDESDRAVVLAVPFRRHGRDWLEFSMLDDVTTANQLYSTEREDLTAIGSSHGPEAFAGYLASIGVTHVMSIVGTSAYPLEYRLEEPWFVPRSEMVLNAYGNEPETVQLLEVRGDASRSPIEGCPRRCVVGDGYPFLQTALEIDGPEGSVGAIDDDRSWWMVERELTVQLFMATLATVDYSASVAFRLENPCPDAVEVRVERDGVERVLPVAAGSATLVTLEVDASTAASLIEITSDGRGCAAGPDGEDVHLRVERPVLTDPVGR